LSMIVPTSQWVLFEDDDVDVVLMATEPCQDWWGWAHRYRHDFASQLTEPTHDTTLEEAAAAAAVVSPRSRRRLFSFSKPNEPLIVRPLCRYEHVLGRLNAHLYSDESGLASSGTKRLHVYVTRAFYEMSIGQSKSYCCRWVCLAIDNGPFLSCPD
jgi:hypothetical protein